MLLRLRAAGVPLLRLGRPASVHPALRDCLPGGALWPDASVAALRALPRRAGVVRAAAAAAAAPHPIPIRACRQLCKVHLRYNFPHKASPAAFVPPLFQLGDQVEDQAEVRTPAMLAAALVQSVKASNRLFR